MGKGETLRQSMAGFLRSRPENRRSALDKVKEEIGALWRERGIMREPNDKCALYMIQRILKDNEPAPRKEEMMPIYELPPVSEWVICERILDRCMYDTILNNMIKSL